jgi:hypothetical protein
MAVGLPAKVSYANGDVFSASDINDTNGTINLIGQTNNFYAGKNKIINGDMRVSQRGTSFSNPANFAYLLDRYAIYYDGTAATRTISQQTFTPGTAPVAGYEGANFFRYAQTVAGVSNTVNLIYQRIEDVRTLAGQSAVLSVWLKADSARTVSATARQYFGSGGSGDVNTGFTGSASVTTSWQRFSFTISMPSISGKTIGTSSALEIQLSLPSGTTPTIDIWGLQLESGSTATAFQTATGTIQGELAACQRYYFRTSADASNNYAGYCNGYAETSTAAYGWLNLPVPMRTTPSSLDYSNIAFERFGGTGYTATNCQLLGARLSTQCIGINLTISGATAGNVGHIRSAVSTTGYLGFSAEL